MIHILDVFCVFIPQLSVNKKIRQLSPYLLASKYVYKAPYIFEKTMQTYTPKNRTNTYKAKLLVANMYKNFSRSNTSHKYITISVIIGCIGLFLPWVSTEETTYNSFSLICGFSGYTFLATYIFSIFAITQNKKKRELKNSLKLHVNDYSILLFSGFYIAMGSILLFFSFLGYKADIGGIVSINTFSSGLIVEIFAGCLLCFG